ncbi:MAG: MFS transporter [Sphingomonas fennica]
MEMSQAAAGGGATRGAGGIFAMALLFAALISEGFDLQMASFAAPAVATEFGTTRAAMGPFLSASLVGVLLGAVAVAPLGDRFGRRRLIVGGCLAYGILSLAGAFATSLGQLTLLRFVIGLGLGGVLPNALALAGDLARPGRTAMAGAMIGIGITFGGVVAGLASAALIPAYGWRGVFVTGGVLPLAIAALLAAFLPESPVLPGRARDRRIGLGELLRHGRAGMTLPIWLVFACVLMTVYLLTGWIPLLLTQEGFSVREAALVATLFQGGGVVGGVVASLALHRHGWRVVAFFAAGAALVLMALAAFAAGTLLLSIGVFAVGFFVTGMQNAINGAGGASYPPRLRASGLGWALGIGRLGSIAGPLVGGLAATFGMTTARDLFLLPLLPVALAAAAALWLATRIAFDDNRENM